MRYRTGWDNLCESCNKLKKVSVGRLTWLSYLPCGSCIGIQCFSLWMKRLLINIFHTPIYLKICGLGFDNIFTEHSLDDPSSTHIPCMEP